MERFILSLSVAALSVALQVPVVEWQGCRPARKGTPPNGLPKQWAVQINVVPAHQMIVHSVFHSLHGQHRDQTHASRGLEGCLPCHGRGAREPQEDSLEGDGGQDTRGHGRSHSQPGRHLWMLGLQVEEHAHVANSAADQAAESVG